LNGASEKTRRRPFLAVASAPAIAAVAATAATTTPAAAAVSATAATAPATAEAAATAAARLALARLVDGERAPVERFAVELRDRGLRVLLAAELDEREPARLSGHAIGNDADAHDFAPTGGACLTKTSFVRMIREIPYVNASSHSLSLPKLP
jgi:hypothetical protein